MQDLIEEYKDVLCIEARRAVRRRSRLNYQEAYDEGVFGLWKASRDYDPTRKMTFRSYVILRVRWAIMGRERELLWGYRSKRVHVAQFDPELFGGTRLDKSLENLENRDQLEWFLNQLLGRKSEVAKALWLDGLSITEVAERDGLTRSAIREALHRARKELGIVREQRVGAVAGAGALPPDVPAEDALR